MRIIPPRYLGGIILMIERIILKGDSYEKKFH